ncbi:MAG: OsmC family protein [Bradymonadia bacterium]
MEVEVRHVTDVAWMVSGPSGHGVIIDGAPKIGGRNLGMRPMEMVLAGLGGCTAMDVMTTLRKQRQDVTDCRITLHAERADAVPAVFTEVKIHYHVYGHTLRRAAVERAVSLSMETYCSVSRMLKPSVSITYDYTCYDASTNEEQIG